MSEIDKSEILQHNETAQDLGGLNSDSLITEESPAETLDEIHGERVALESSAVAQVNGEKVDMNNSAAFAVSAQDVHAVNSAILMAEVNNLELEQNNILLFANASDAELHNSQAGTVIANTTHMDQSVAGVLITRDVQASSIRTGILLAGHVEGQVETMLDTPRVFLAGMTAGVAMGVVVLVGNLLRSRRKN
jgi:hypothetical protein